MNDEIVAPSDFYVACGINKTGRLKLNDKVVWWSQTYRRFFRGSVYEIAIERLGRDRARLAVKVFVENEKTWYPRSRTFRRMESLYPLEQFAKLTDIDGDHS